MQVETNRVYSLWGLLPFRHKEIELTANSFQFKTGKKYQVLFSDITKVKVSSSFLTYKFSIYTPKKTYRISGLKKRDARALEHNFKLAMVEFLFDPYLINEYEKLIKSFLSDTKFYSSFEWQKFAEIKALYKKLVYCFVNLDADEDLKEKFKLDTFNLIKDHDFTEISRGKHNQKVVPILVDTYNEFFDSIERKPLSGQQRIACVTNDDHNLVVAGAGTGKTSTIVGKAGLLLKANLAKPENILLLAYGQKAAEEMNERIQERLGELASDITATTFHAFGNDVIAQVKGYKSSITNFEEQPLQFSQFLTKLLVEKTEQDKVYKKLLVNFLVNYPNPEKSRLDFETIEEYKEFLDSCRLVTLNGEYVKSVGELRVSNFLALWGVNYQYEAKYEFETQTLENSQYKPDFYLPDHKLYIEYFGIDRNHNTAPFVNKQNYLDSMQWKFQLHETKKTDVAMLYSFQLTEGTLEQDLSDILDLYAIETANQDLDSLLDNLKSMENSPWGNFLDLIENFLKLYKQGHHNIEELRSKLVSDGQMDIARTEVFLKLFEPILNGYQEYLETEDEIDFSDMIATATNLINESKYIHKYSYVLVDEFQDLSLGRGKLIQALLNAKPNVRLFGVGDDWQSIYRFAGSDMHYFTKFAETFSPASEIPLDKTYRFNNKIHEVSSEFVMKNPDQVTKQIHTEVLVEHAAVRLSDIREFAPENGGAKRIKNLAYINNIDKALASFSRHTQKHQKEKSTVLIIGRFRLRNMRILEDLNIEHHNHHNLDVKYSTAHASKGLEADYVILTGIDEGGFPFSKENDELIDFVLPLEESFSYAEERRLFYVALTRARHYVYVLFDSLNPSPFVLELSELEGHKIAQDKELNHLQATCPDCSAGKLVRKISKYNKSFYVCSMQPACDYITSACKQCNSAMKTYSQGFRACTNKMCQEVEVSCKRCGKGTMVLKAKNSNDPFYGCSSFHSSNPNPCRENIKIIDYKTRLHKAFALIGREIPEPQKDKKYDLPTIVNDTSKKAAEPKGYYEAETTAPTNELTPKADKETKQDNIEKPKAKSSTIKPKSHSVDEIRKEHKRAYMPWTIKDDEKLETLYKQGKTTVELCEIFSRQPGGIRSRLKKIGLK